MSQPPRFFAPALLALATLAAAPASLGEEPDRYQLLQAMPRERRIALAENLERFDKLDSAERAAIRKLDAQISRKDPVEQARYRSLLRRYHLWVNSLTDDQKKALAEAGSDEARFNEARQLRQKELQEKASGFRFFGIRTGEYGLIGPFEAAHLLRIWNKLPDSKKAEIEKNQVPGRLLMEIRAQNKSVGVQFHPFPIADEKLYDAEIEANKAFKQQIGYENTRRVDLTPKRAEAAHAKGEAAPKKFEQRFSEFLYFEKNPPKAVSQKNLERFSAICPTWLHSMLDSLSAYDARFYLTILYRQLYPEPAEMPADSKPGKPATGGTPGPAKANTKKSGSPAPF